MTYTLSISLCRMPSPGELWEDPTEEERREYEEYVARYKEFAMTLHQWKVGMLETNADNPGQSKVKTVFSPLFDPADQVFKQEELERVLAACATTMSRRASQAIHH